MSSLRARVQNGRILVDEPTALPEGTVLDLVADDEGDNLTDTDRAALERAISKAWQSIQDGRGRPVADVLAARTRR
jgi:hypothetical protein